jgi:hypothetical protein
MIAVASPGDERNRPNPSKASLSAAQSRFVELMQDINFGEFRDITIRNGEPVLDREPIRIREIKFGGDNGCRLERQCRDFVLKTQVVELLDWMHSIQNGVIESLEVKHGLPFRMFLRESSN